MYCALALVKEVEITSVEPYTEERLLHFRLFYIKNKF